MNLGIDLGTSGVKAVLLDDEQQVVASTDAPLSVLNPQPLWSEQHPHDWWRAVELAVAALRARAPQAWPEVRAIGLSGQMHGAVLLDGDFRVLRPAILWNDGRSFAECAELEVAEPASRAITGNLAMPGFTAPKLLWVRKHEAAIFSQLRTVLLPKDWLRLQLTGELATDMSDASGTLWLDVGQRVWSDAMLRAGGMSPAHVPRLVEGSDRSGGLRPAVAEDWGLRPGTMVAGGAADNAASAVGLGVLRAGEGFISLGTSGVVFLAGDAFRPAPDQAVHAFAHALPGLWHQMSVMLSAASALAWAARVCGQTPAALAASAAALPTRRLVAAPLFLPYLSGERTPHNDPHASGVLMHLRGDHEAADIGYAVMEGVAFGLLDGLQAMRSSGSVVGEQLGLVGGGSRSDAWCQLVADVLGCTLRRHDGADAAAAVGAARLAWLARGGAVQHLRGASGGRVFVPEPAAHVVHAARHERFRALYPALKPHFELGRLVAQRT